MKNKDLKQTIEKVFGDYARESKRELERSERINASKLRGAKTCAKELIQEIIEKAVLMHNAVPAYYFLGGFGNESLDHPYYTAWRQNSQEAMINLIKSGYSKN